MIRLIFMFFSNLFYVMGVIPHDKTGPKEIISINLYVDRSCL